MAETANYGLYLTDTSQEKFKEWREKMNSQNEDSNMQKIDKALGEKAEHSKNVEATLLASAWVGESSPYTQTLTVTDLEEGMNGNISLSETATTEQTNVARLAMMSRLSQEAGKLVIQALGTKPQQDIPVCITLID